MLLSTHVVVTILLILCEMLWACVLLCKKAWRGRGRERGKGGGNFLGQESSLNVWKYGRNLKVWLGRGSGRGERGGG